MPLSEDFDALRLHLVSAVPQFWADRGHYSYLESPRPEDALLFFLPEESGCAFTPACTGTFTAPSCFCRPSCMN